MQGNAKVDEADYKQINESMIKDFAKARDNQVKHAAQLEIKDDDQSGEPPRKAHKADKKDKKTNKKKKSKKESSSESSSSSEEVEVVKKGGRGKAPGRTGGRGRGKPVITELDMDPTEKKLLKFVADKDEWINYGKKLLATSRL